MVFLPIMQYSWNFFWQRIELIGRVFDMWDYILEWKSAKIPSSLSYYQCKVVLYLPFSHCLWERCDCYCAACCSCWNYCSFSHCMSEITRDLIGWSVEYDIIVECPGLVIIADAQFAAVEADDRCAMRRAAVKQCIWCTGLKLAL